MSSSSSSHNKYKGVRQRKWGKWVSEIRVPGTPERLWLGSYATPEAAATAHDVAYYCLRGGDSSLQSLNFPLTNLPTGARVGISPRSVQKVASDAGLAVDARLKVGHTNKVVEDDKYQQGNDFNDHNNVTWQQHCSSWGTTSNNNYDFNDHNNVMWQQHYPSWGTTSNNNDWWHSTTSDPDQENLNISVEDYM